MDRDKFINKRVQSIAKDHGCSVAEVYTVQDVHPIKLDRDQFLRRTLALELLRLDELEEAFAVRPWAATSRPVRCLDSQRHQIRLTTGRLSDSNDSGKLSLRFA